MTTSELKVGDTIKFKYQHTTLTGKIKGKAIDKKYFYVKPDSVDYSSDLTVKPEAILARIEEHPIRQPVNLELSFIIITHSCNINYHSPDEEYIRGQFYGSLNGEIEIKSNRRTGLDFNKKYTLTFKEINE